MVKYRPWLMAAILSSVVLGLCVYLHNEISWILTAAGIMLAAVFCFLYRKKDRLKIVLCTVSVLGCIFSFSVQYQNVYRHALEYAGKIAIISGTVVGELSDSATGESRVEIKVTAINNTFLKHPIAMAVTQEQIEKPLQLGDTVRFYGEIKRYRTGSGNLSDRCYLKTSINADSKIVWLSPAKEGVSLKLEKIRSYLITTAEEVLSPDAAQIFCGMLYGRSDYLETSQRMAFRYSGFAHLLAVSGLHIQVIASIISAIFGGMLFFTGHRNVVAQILTVVVIWGFILLIGCPLSAVRSGIMVTISILGHWIFKRADTLNSLGISMVIIYLIFPFSVMSIGFWMSVSATFGIGALYTSFSKPLSLLQQWIGERIPTGQKKKRIMSWVVWTRNIADGWVVGSCASIGLLPIYLFYFGYLPLGSILFGGFLGFLFSAILLVGVLFSFLAVLDCSAGWIVGGYLLEPLLKLLEKIVAWTAEKSFLVLPLRREFAVVFAVLAGISLLLLNRKVCNVLFHIEKRWVIGLFLTAFFGLGLLFTQYYQYNIIEITAVGGYSGKDVAVISGNSATLFVAYGDEENGEEMVDYLIRRGVHRVDQIFLLQPGVGVPESVPLIQQLLQVGDLYYNTYGFSGAHRLFAIETGDFPLTCGMVAHFVYREQGLNVALEYGEKKLYILQDLSLLGNEASFGYCPDAVWLYEPIHTKDGMQLETDCLIPLSDISIPYLIRAGQTIWYSLEPVTITLDRYGSIQYP